MRGSTCVFGGAFDPPHLGHRLVVEACLEQLPIDRLVVLPSGRHPFKGEGCAADGEVRLRLCRLAFADLAAVEVSDHEVRQTQTGFTVDTLAWFRQQLTAAAELYFVIGSDNLGSLWRWHRPAELLRLARLAVVPRPGAPVAAEALARLPISDAERRAALRHVLAVRPSPIAATEIRRRLRAGEPVDGMLAGAVEAAIRAGGLYRA